MKNAESTARPAFKKINTSENVTRLTKREHFAALAMQGFLAAPDLTLEKYEDIAIHCLKAADALLAELEE